MDASFWHHKWTKNDIGFHENDVNPALVKYVKELALKKGSRVFVPLCGKTLDIAWLLSHGYRVAGAELSELAIGQLFAGLGLKPNISNAGKVHRYSAKNIDIFAGNIFDVSEEILGKVDAVYDRAALVALPEDMRKRYTSHVMDITQNAPQLLLSYVYDQSLVSGPPFSVSNEEIKRHFKDSFQLTLLESMPIPGGLKGKCAATENVWLMTYTLPGSV